MFDKPEQVLVPTLVQYELRRWVLRERGEDVADRVIAMTRNSRVVALAETTALHAAAPAIEKFLSSVVSGDAAVVGKIKADSEAWHQDRPNRIARAIDIEAAASETKQQ